jgi:photosystem II stability/assembly factor-like uncharacterized protein
MAHGLVTTGVSFPDATIQTTAADMTATGTYIVGAPGQPTPTGWVHAPTTLSKASFPALYNIIGNETNINQLGNVTGAGGGIASYVGFAGDGSVSTGDRRVDRVATNGSGTFIVLGDAGRMFRTTNNGSTWTDLGQVGNTGDVYAITFGNGTFIVTGASKALRSTDNGATWTLTVSPGGLGQNFYSVIYDPSTGRFVASSSAGYFIFSTDNGANWTNTGLNFTDRVYKMAAGQGYIIMGSNGGNFGWSSNGGSSWTQDYFTSAGAQTVNKIIYANNRFFAISDNGDITYTTRNSNPTVVDNWHRKEDPLPSRNTQVAGQELTDIAWIESAKIWIIGTNAGGKWFWAPDFTDGEIPYWYEMTGMHPFGQQVYADSAVSGNIMIQASYGPTPGTDDGYGNPINRDGVAVYNFNNLTTPPSTHFHVPANYIATGVYNGGAAGGTYSEPVPKVFVKV